MNTRINIVQELNSIRRKSYDPQEALLEEAKTIIRNGRIFRPQPASQMLWEQSGFSPVTLDHSRIFTISHVRELCVRYRLRFLDLSAFRNELPAVALKNMAVLEEKLGYQPSYKLIAPASFFRLADRDKDPVLLARVGEDQYFMVAQWGNDMSILRKIAAFPLRSLETFLVTLTVLAFIVTALLPENWLVTNQKLHDDILYYRGLFFCWFMVSSFFFMVFLGMTFRKNFNDAEWESNYFN